MSRWILDSETIATLIQYHDNRIPPGSFAQAVLANDLYDAIRRGSERSLCQMPAMVRYILNQMDSRSFGSRERVQRWLQRAEGEET